MLFWFSVLDITLGVANHLRLLRSRIVVATTQDELRLFARYFHQDFGLVFSDVEVGAAEYFKTLSLERKLKLRQELEAILAEFPGMDDIGLKNAWHRAGAQFWPKERALRATLEAWFSLLG
jgi:CdiI immunity protein